MKKILLALLVLVISLVGFTACMTTDIGTKDDLQAAANYLKGMHNEEYKEYTSSDYKVPTMLTIKGIKFDVKWSVETANPEDIKLVENEDNTVTVDLYEETRVELAYALKAVVTNKGGASVEVVFNHKVPRFVVNTWKEYMDAKGGTTLRVEGVVVALNLKANGNKRNGIYFADENGAYYAYGVADKLVDGINLAVGQKIRVVGNKDVYNGTHELKDCQEVTILSEEIAEVTPKDITEIFAKAKDTSAEELAVLQSDLVTIKGVTISEHSDNFNFILNGKESYVRISGSSSFITAEEEEALKNTHKNNFGAVCDVTGIGTLFNGVFYLAPVSGDAFANFSATERTEAEKVEFERETVSIKTLFTKDGTTTLPATGKVYNDVKITWESSSANAVVKDGKLVVTVPAKLEKVTVTATLTLGATIKTVQFEVTLEKEEETKPVEGFNYIKGEPEIGKAYKFAVEQAALKKTLYFTGKVALKDGKPGNFLETTEDVAQAADVILEGEKDKLYITVKVDGKVNYVAVEVYEYEKDGKKKTGKKLVVTETKPATTFKYVAGENDEFRMMVSHVGGKDYYIGAYGTFNTMSASETSYVNAGNVDTKQFIARFGTVVGGETKPEEGFINTAPVVGTKYKLGVERTGKGDTLYFTGKAKAEQSWYFTTTTDITLAADVFVESAGEGKYHLAFEVDGVKKYIDMYERSAEEPTKGTMSIVEQAPTRFLTYNAEYNTLVYTSAAGEVFYLGASDMHDTLSCSNIGKLFKDSYMSHFAVAGSGEVEPEPEKPVETFNYIKGEPEIGKAYKFALEQASLKKTLYFTGRVADYKGKPGNFLETTEDIAQAADVVLEGEKDKLYITVKVNGKTNYVAVEVYEYEKDGKKKTGKKLVVTETKPATTFKYVAGENNELRMMVSNVGGTDYYIGTYNTFNTMSASETSYVNAGNVDTKQFVARFGTVSECGEVTPDPDPQPENPTNEPAGRADFATGTVEGKRDNSYAERTTTDGWHVTNGRIDNVESIFSTGSNFITFGKDAVNTLTSPVIKTGIKKITFQYAVVYDTFIDFTIEIIQNGKVVATKNFKADDVAKKTTGNFEWVLDKEVKGEFTIKLTGSKRLSIADLVWFN